MIEKQTGIEIIVKIDQRLDWRLMDDPFSLLLLQIAGIAQRPAAGVAASGRSHGDPRC